MLYNEHSGADGTAWHCYAVLTISSPLNQQGWAALLCCPDRIKGGLYESGCYGRRGRIEATTIDDSTPQANGAYCRKTCDGAHSQLVETPWYYRSCCHGSVSGKQH